MPLSVQTEYSMYIMYSIMLYSSIVLVLLLFWLWAEKKTQYAAVLHG